MNSTGDDPSFILAIFDLFFSGGVDDASSIYASWVTWLIIASVAAAGLKFVPLLLWYRGIAGHMQELLGHRTTREDLVAERAHSYRVWGSALSAICILGGALLLLLGAVVGAEGTGTGELTIAGVMTLKDAAPGTVMLACGVVLWMQTHKQRA